MKKVILFICFVVCVMVADAQVVNSVHQDYTKVAKDSFALVNGSLPSYKAGKHLQAAAYCEMGALASVACGAALVCVVGDGSSCKGKSTKIAVGGVCGLAAVSLYIAKLCHIHTSGKYLKIVSSGNGIGVSYTFGKK